MGTLDELMDLAAGRPGALAWRAQPKAPQGPRSAAQDQNQILRQPTPQQQYQPDWLTRLSRNIQLRQDLTPVQVRNVRKILGSVGRALGAANRAVARAQLPAHTSRADIVNVGGIMVHRSIAPRIQALLEHAAREGIRLTGGGYRSPQRQAELYNAWRSGRYKVPAVARPGRSRHEHGLAIDFSGVRRGSREFGWLARNAARYGLYNLPSEPWHWSVDGR